jgi:dTDP-4-dehydrorhamnose 3,5-epimerase-like enzyme
MKKPGTDRKLIDHANKTHGRRAAVLPVTGRPMPNVSDIKIDDLPKISDDRGRLVVAEFSKFVPFPVARLFYVHEVPANTTRGKHAHRRCRQYLICQSGRVLVEATDGKQTRRIELNPGQAVLIEPGIFTSETYADHETVLLVLCDRPHDRADYIQTMEEFHRVYAGR